VDIYGNYFEKGYLYPWRSIFRLLFSALVFDYPLFWFLFSFSLFPFYFPFRSATMFSSTLIVFYPNYRMCLLTCTSHRVMICPE
jgi:hypothetical protein